MGKPETARTDLLRFLTEEQGISKPPNVFSVTNVKKKKCVIAQNKTIIILRVCNKARKVFVLLIIDSLYFIRVCRYRVFPLNFICTNMLYIQYNMYYKI